MCKPNYSNFYSYFQIFITMVTGGWSETNFICTVKFADPENPQFGARIGYISPVQAEF